jgi:S1-C subfamily serine protease
MTRREVFRNVKRATVAIATHNPTATPQPFVIVGSGFSVAAEGLIVTCRHVAEAFMEKPVADQITDIPASEKGKPLQRSGPFGYVKAYAVFYVLQPMGVAVLLAEVGNIVSKTDFDLSLLKIGLHSSFPSGYPYLEPETFENVEEGDEIATCGFPLGSFLYGQLGTFTSSFTTGIVSSIIPASGQPKEVLKGFQLGLVATHGNSGGPVFSVQSGKVFGVLKRGVANQEGEVLSGITMAEPVYPIIEPAIIEYARSFRVDKS